LCDVVLEIPQPALQNQPQFAGINVPVAVNQTVSKAPVVLAGGRQPPGWN
jgi:hypothetical protein